MPEFLLLTPGEEPNKGTYERFDGEEVARAFVAERAKADASFNNAVLFEGVGRPVTIVREPQVVIGSLPSTATPQSRGPGRPPGSKNKNSRN